LITGISSEGIRKAYSDYVLKTFTESNFVNFIENPYYRLLISETDNTLQGFVLVNLLSQFEDEKHGFEVEKLYVHKQFKGVGRTLLAEVEHQFGASFWLYTRVENDSNRFYQHLGFRYIRTAKR